MEKTRGTLLRPVLWAVLILSLAANAALSGLGISVVLGAVSGVVALTCGAALAAHHYRNR